MPLQRGVLDMPINDIFTHLPSAACPPLNLIDCDLPAYQLGKGANKQEEQPNCFGRHGIGRFVVSRMKSNNYYYFLFPILKDILVPSMTKTEYYSVQNKKGKIGMHSYKHFHLI